MSEKANELSVMSDKLIDENEFLLIPKTDLLQRRSSFIEGTNMPFLGLDEIGQLPSSIHQAQISIKFGIVILTS